MGANENTAADPAAQRTPLHKTTALCPDCLDELPAEVYADAEGVVWMERTCPDHGRLATRMWPDAEHYQWLRSLAFPMTAPQNTLPGHGAVPARLRHVQPPPAARHAAGDRGHAQL